MLWQNRDDVWAGQPLAIVVFNLFSPWAARLFWQNELFTPGMFGTWLIHSPVPSQAAATVTLWEQCEELSGVLCSGPDTDLWNVTEGICISCSYVTWISLWCVAFCLQCWDGSLFRVKSCGENMENFWPRQGFPNCVYCLYTPGNDIFW